MLTENGRASSAKAEIISDYLAFCLDECVPTVSRVVSNDKTWITRKVRMLLSARTAALNSCNQAKLKSIELKLQREIRKAKRTYKDH